MQWNRWEENTDRRKDICTLNESSVGLVYTEQRKEEGEEEDERDEEGDIFMNGESEKGVSAQCCGIFLCAML